MKAFLRSTLRSFKKDKVFTTINILGLTIGLSSSLLIFLIVKNDLSYDAFHKKSDQIFRVNVHMSSGDNVRKHPTCPSPAGQVMEETFPQVEKHVRIDQRREQSIQHNGELISEETLGMTDAAFFDVFDFPILAGDPAKLNEPNQVFVSRTLAAKLADTWKLAIGLTINIADQYNVVVAGVMEDFPTTTDLPFDLLLSRASDGQSRPSWGRLELGASTFVVLGSAAQKLEVEEGLEQMLIDNTNERMAGFFDLVLQPMSDIHFNSEYGNYNDRTVPMGLIWALSGIASILLIIACINFINLSTANAIKRSKEVGIRKILGSSRKTLIGKFVGEAAVLTLLSFAIAIPLAKALHGQVQQLVGFEFDFQLFADPAPWLFGLALATFIILVAGIYQSFVTSRFQPITVVRQDRVKGAGVRLRQVLVVFQFAVSQVLLIGLFVVKGQLNYFLGADMGFDQEGTMTVELPRDRSNAEKLKTALLQIPGVDRVSLASSSPISGNRMITSFSYEGAPEGERHFTELKVADTDYMELFDFELLAGRSYFKADSVQELVVNEAMTAELGYETPDEAIGGKILLGPGEPDVIVGVLSDFHFSSMYEKIGPVAISTNPDNYALANVKLKVSETSAVLQQMESAWSELYPNEQFNYDFLDQTVTSYYEREQRLSQVILWFTIIALFIGGIGLYGMVTYVVNNRIKEIGIRKVLGASFNSLLTLISREFVVLLLIAFVVSAPLSWYLMNNWLSDFYYRIDLGPVLFVAALASSFLVALVSVLQKSVYATRINPVQTLRDE